jgi:hypothetical protein
MVLDLEGREYYSRFAKYQPMKFEGLIENLKEKSLGVSGYFQQLAKYASNIVTISSAFPVSNPLEVLPTVFRTIRGSERG